MLNKESTKQWFPKFLMSKARKESTGSNKSIDRSTDGGALLKASISKSDRHFQASVGDNYSIDSGVGSRGRTGRLKLMVGLCSKNRLSWVVIFLKKIGSS